MRVLIELRVYALADSPCRVAGYSLTKTVDMPQLPQRSIWLTFGPEGRALTFGPVNWEIDWFDENSIYRVVCRVNLQDAECHQIMERLQYLEASGWSRSAR